MTVNIVEEFQSIARSFGALIEGLSYVDEDVAEKLAAEFSKKLADMSRNVYIEMAGKVSKELAKSPNKKRRRKSVSVREDIYSQPRTVMPLRPVSEDEELYQSIGTQELEENTNSFIGSGPLSSTEDISDVLSNQQITHRSAGYPPTRDQGGRMVPQKRLPDKNQ